MTGDSNNKWIGKRTPRPDGADKVTGRAAYAADTNMPGMIWGKVLRSPHPHARIKSIDTSKAEAMPGVKAVMTAKDIVDFPVAKGPVMLGIQDMRWMCRKVMARTMNWPWLELQIVVLPSGATEIRQACGSI